MTPSSRILGVLLAGGENRRFGSRKAFVALDGVRVIDRCVGTLAEVCREVVIVANEPEPYEAFGLAVRPDVRPGAGVLGGIYTAVTWAEELELDGAAVLACDMPFVPPPLLATLVERADASGVSIAASDGRRGMEPLCAVYGIGCRASIERRLDEGQRPIVSFFADVPVNCLDRETVARFGHPDEMFFNMNHPEDRRAAEKLARSFREDSRSRT